MTPRRKLTTTEIEAALARVPAWQLRDGKLHRQLTFETFVEAFGLMSQVALLAERANHHPEWSNVYNRVDIDLSTHDVGGISKLDFALAEEIDALVDN